MKKMIKWRKPIVVALVLLFVLPSVAGCGPTPTEDPLVYYLYPSTDDIWWTAAEAGAKAGVENNGGKFVSLSAERDSVKQVNQFDDAITAGADAIMYSAVDAKAVTTAVEKARKEGIIVTAVSLPPEVVVDMTIGWEMPLWGTLQAEATVEELTKLYGEPKGKVLVLMGALDDAMVILMTDPFKEVVEKYPNVEVQYETTNWDLTKATDLMEDIFVARGPFDVLVIQSDFLLSSVLPVLANEGYTVTGGEKHTILIGNGGNPEALQAMRDGWMDVTLVTPINEVAQITAAYTIALVKGEKVELGPATLEVSGLDISGLIVYNSEFGTRIDMAGSVLYPEGAEDINLWGNN